MNKFLADALSSINGFAAFMLVIFGGLSGFGVGLRSGIAGVGLRSGVSVVTAILGLIGGLIAAIFIFGLLALFIDMRRELVQIREALQVNRGNQATLDRRMAEPRLPQ